jgi:hypothetical protein
MSFKASKRPVPPPSERTALVLESLRTSKSTVSHQVAGKVGLSSGLDTCDEPIRRVPKIRMRLAQKCADQDRTNRNPYGSNRAKRAVSAAEPTRRLRLGCMSLARLGITVSTPPTCRCREPRRKPRSIYRIRRSPQVGRWRRQHRSTPGHCLSGSRCPTRSPVQKPSRPRPSKHSAPLVRSFPSGSVW